MSIPFTDSGTLHGVLTVSRERNSGRFTPTDLEMAADFAGQASVALALARGRDDRTRLALLEERGRIARDLHDRVIQRLFAAGLGLETLDVDPGDLRTRAGIDVTVRALDDSIAEIRTAIFALVNPTARERGALRHRIIDAVSEAGAALATSPRVVFSGALDLLVPERMGDDIVAVVRESLANVAKHAAATETLVSVVIERDSVVIDVTDNGVGLGHVGRASGTTNLERRAADLRGHFTLRNREGGGTHLQWSAALPHEPEDRS
jgi:signal transduction histidine kinase